MSNKSNKNKRITSNKAKNSSRHGKNFLIIKHLREASLIMLIAVAAFFVLALFSYNPFDPGWSRTAQHAKIVNLAGGVGAWIADLFLYFFGILAYLFPMGLFYLSVVIMLQQLRDSIYLWWMRIFGFGVTVLSSCAIISLLEQRNLTIKVSMPVSLGGVLGDALSAYLHRHVHFWGACLISIHCFLAGLTAIFGLSWLNLFKVMHLLGIKIFNLVLKLKHHLVLLQHKLAKLGCSLINLSKKRGAILKPRKTSDNILLQLKATFALISFKRIFTLLRSLHLPKLTARKITTSPQDQNVAPASLNVVTNIISSNETKVTQQREIAKDFIKKIQQKNSNNLVKVAKQSNNLPPIDLLEPNDEANHKLHKDYLPDPDYIIAKLKDFGILVKITDILPGPVVTRVEMELAPGTKVNKITTLSKDLARSFSVPSVRVVEVIPGKTVIGLEIPNKHRLLVRLREILSSDQYNLANSPLTLALGKDIAGIPFTVDLTKMPHLLVAGTTGSGKSVGVNAMLLSILFKAKAEDVRLILIDPKMLELSIYDGIPHLLTPVVTDMKDAANALNWCVFEMERRYKLMASVGVRNLLSFNLKIQAAHNRNHVLNPMYNAHLPENPNNKKYLEKLPYIVVIIDEFADMMMVVGKKVEEQISRIAQKARAAGIHMILATQRPSVDVITGLIKANIPTRIAFQVSSRIDSRTILDQQGAEQLLGYGDLLYLPPGSGIPLRVHGAFLSDDEVHKVVSYLKGVEATVEQDIINFSKIEQRLENEALLQEHADDNEDALYDQAVAIVTKSRKASISYLQRRLKIGFNRAARLIESLQQQNVITTQSNGVREVLAPPPPEEVDH